MHAVVNLSPVEFTGTYGKTGIRKSCLRHFSVEKLKKEKSLEFRLLHYPQKRTLPG